MNHNTPAQEVKSLGTLFFTFFKIGLFTFGGGYAMIALLEEEMCIRDRIEDEAQAQTVQQLPVSLAGEFPRRDAPVNLSPLDVLALSLIHIWHLPCRMT